MFELPIETKNDGDYLKELKKSVDECIEKYKRLKPDVKDPDVIDIICEEIQKNYFEIKECFEMSFNGNYYSSIEKMRDLLKKYEDELCFYIDTSYAFGGKLACISRDEDSLILFKGRTTEYPYQKLEIDEMHQIPLTDRWKISTQRFSMPGVPCLYLASNSYIVWNELGKPALDKLQISAFKVEKSREYKVIDLTIPYNEVFRAVQKKILKNPDEMLKLNSILAFAESDNRYLKMASLWPLYAAVSIQCSQGN